MSKIQKKEAKRLTGQINKINDISFHEKIAQIIFKNIPNVTYSCSGGEVLINLMDIDRKTFDEICFIYSLYLKNENYTSEYNKVINSFR
jgi:hypothetical protein